jgi:uncharacterized protein YdiU (UPF0061 family)
MSVRFAFDNSYQRLPQTLHVRVAPTPVSAPAVVSVNERLAATLGLDPVELRTAAGAAVLVGNKLPEGAAAIALAYAGHQFGNFVPRLGDGRAILLGEVVGTDGARRDIQLKGSGRTPFSRGGDGRAALGPVLREYLVSEAMAALGVPTTRALAAATTGDWVLREAAMPGAILVRVAASHIRIGTFEFAATQQDPLALKALADHAIARHYPEALGTANPYHALLTGVVKRQAALVASWLLIGFIHGVMNTDNTSISGETIDYGPCAFLDAYNPGAVFSSIDHRGRYAYDNQPRIMQWNLARFAETLLPLLHADRQASVAQATEAIEAFSEAFHTAYLGGLARKIGLAAERDGDGALVQALLSAMEAGQADFTLTFRRLCSAAASPAADEGVRELFVDPTAFDAWAGRWRARLAQEDAPPQAIATAMRAVNPARIPRNHKVEDALTAAVRAQDFAPFERMLVALSEPFEERPDCAEYDLPGPAMPGYRTFCGT